MGSTPLSGVMIPGTNMPALTSELAGLREMLDQLNQPNYGWVGPLTPPPGYAAQMEITRLQAEWASRVLAGEDPSKISAEYDRRIRDLQAQVERAMHEAGRVTAQEMHAADTVLQYAERGEPIPQELARQVADIPVTQETLPGLRQAVQYAQQAQQQAQTPPPPPTQQQPQRPPAQTAPGGSPKPREGEDNLSKQVGDAPMNGTLDDKIIARAGGNNYYSWDEWNWFYEQVTGKAGPAPEDRGFQRNAQGAVLINGEARIDYWTWKRYAFPNGFDGEQRRDGGGEGTQAPNILTRLLELVRKLLTWVVRGGS